MFRRIIASIVLFGVVSAPVGARACCEGLMRPDECTDGAFTISRSMNGLRAIGDKPECANNEREHEVVQGALALGSWVRWGLSERTTTYQQDRIPFMPSSEIRNLIDTEPLTPYEEIESLLPLGFHAFVYRGPHTVSSNQRVYVFTTDRETRCEIFAWDGDEHAPAAGQPTAAVVCNFSAGRFDANLAIPSPLLPHVGWLASLVRERGPELLEQ